MFGRKKQAPAAPAAPALGVEVTQRNNDCVRVVLSSESAKHWQRSDKKRDNWAATFCNPGTKVWAFHGPIGVMEYEHKSYEIASAEDADRLATFFSAVARSMREHAARGECRKPVA